MTSTEMTRLIRLMALWSGLASLAMGVQIARRSIFLLRLQGPVPTSALIVPLAFGAASVIGVSGACLLWQLSAVGRRACLFSGVALIIGVAPAAILRGQVVVVAAMTVTLAVVFTLSSRPMSRLCVT